LIAGNLVLAQIRARTETQLPQATVELAHSRASLLCEPLQSSAIEWTTALVASALPERQACPPIYQALAGLLDAIEAAPSAKGWSSALARFEEALVAELGYGRESHSPADLFDSLRWSGDRLFGEVLPGRTSALRDSRSRLIERLRRALV
jgi:DNA repair protein RecO (recombination protein O)